MTPGCHICERIARFTPDNPYFIAELDTGFAVLGDNQLYTGYTLFIARRCVHELRELPPSERSRFLEEMALVAEAVFRAFEPRKLNYELLGNSVPHLHWHLFPRYADDPDPRRPIWNNDAFWRWPDDAARPEVATIGDRRARLQRALAEARSGSSH